MSDKANGNKYVNKDQKEKIKSDPVVDSKENSKNYFLIPVFIILCIIPLIVKYAIYDTHMTQFSWFAQNAEKLADLFLIYKERAFVAISAIMALAVIIKSIVSRKTIRLIPVFIPLAGYALLALLSAVFSKYAYFSFLGGFSLFEPVTVLLGYCVVVYYIYLFIKSERDFRLILYFLIGLAIVISILGIFQYLGYDFLASKLAYKLIVPSEYNGVNLDFKYGAKRVYMTLYNPNYVGVYVALVLPIIFVMFLFTKKVVLKVLAALAVVGLAFCAVGSHSLSGIIGLAVSVILIVIFLRRSLIKKYYITIPVIVALIIGVVVVNGVTDQYFLNKLKGALTMERSVPALSEMQTTDDGISITYNGNAMKVQYNIDQYGKGYIEVLDEDKKPIPTYIDQTDGRYIVVDDRFPKFNIAPSDDNGSFYIQTEDNLWNFYKNREDGSYYYINRFYRLDKMITADSALFKGYERLASGRGYIWSRTIPLLKKYLILGSGPDTFAMVFPQQDYYNLNQYGFGNEIMNKPHSLYLQTGVQTGVLSLIALLAFYLMYFVSSIKLYIRGKFNSFYAKFGVAVFIGTVSYMVTGLANDSNINTSPIFWTLMGVGIALNAKAKPLIAKELSA